MSKGRNEHEKPRGSVRVSSEVGDLVEHAARGTMREEDMDKDVGKEEEGKYTLDSVTSRSLVAWVRAVSVL